MPLIKFATSCPTCGRKLFAPTEQLGKQIHCPHCQSCFYPSDVFVTHPASTSLAGGTSMRTVTKTSRRPRSSIEPTPCSCTWDPDAADRRSSGTPGKSFRYGGEIRRSDS